ncbi:MAG: response regulator containing a CheY-like receiver domain and an DNA-binding domain [Sphingobacteriaceae bacterium]|jgi:DNA-binding NarL/FixJ family response regulator|nr:response regulator containing a CheY-like receiver domain and an DNA-binding domain [Sphingobacteriaceae bacterium]
MQKNILLVDDHAIVLDGLEALLKTESEYKVTKASVGEFALSYLRSDSFEMMITDYSMPDMDGLTLVKKAKQVSPTTKIIMLSMHDDGHVIREAVSAGLDGYVLKKYAQQELLQAIEVVNNGGQYWSREVTTALLNNSRSEETQETLTDREIEVLKLLVQELNSREIAEKLFISERTVETHRKNLMRKTKAINMVGLVKYAYAHKLA